MLSIIIPTLNEEKVIEDTLSSLKSRLAIPHELIVSDGDSSDRTVEIARKYANQVVTYSGAKRQTIAQGRNAGAKASKGDFLVFMDADCRVTEPNAFFGEALRRFDDPKLSGLVAWVKVMPGMSTIADKIIYALYNRYLSLLNNIFGLGVSGGEFQMMRRADFERIGGYNESLVASEDMELLSRLAKLGKVRLDSNLVVFHTGRRAHKIGWPKLLSLWLANSLSMMVKKKAFSREWEPIR